MLVRDRMSAPPITMDVRGSIAEAHGLMRHYDVRRIPVLQKGRLVGIVTWTDLMRALPSPASTLGAWEVPGLLLRASVKEIMTSNPITIGPDQPIEEAALIMRQEKIGGLPVIENGGLLGVITESDIFEAFLDLTGVRQRGARLVVDMTDHAQAIAELVTIIASRGVALSSIATYTQQARRLAILRVDAGDPSSIVQALGTGGFRVLDMAATAGLSNGKRVEAANPRP
jgi:acetoin utilization protein AcuB